MEEVKELTQFFTAIQRDQRIGTSHISLYMAIFQLYNLNGFRSPVYFRRHELMKLAKINGLATYHNCMKNLVEFGYVRYEVSFKAYVKSRLYLLILIV